jgi:1,4-dihydroxy-2-naphthoate octaprenyltransferase
VAALAFRGVLKHSDDIPALIPHMAQHVMLTLLTPLLLALGILLA